jgi:DNA polymerase-3 subunit gamma/tau
MLSIRPGGSAKTMATFPASARAFCVLDVALAPQPRQAQDPAPPTPAPVEAQPPTGTEAPPESGPAPESPAPGETS